jgi:hypothetical protein
MSSLSWCSLSFSILNLKSFREMNVYSLLSQQNVQCQILTNIEDKNSTYLGKSTTYSGSTLEARSITAISLKVAGLIPGGVFKIFH